MTTATTPQTQYLTVAEVATNLRLSRMTVYRLIKSGQLRALAINGRTFRIPTEAYAAFREQLEAESTARCAPAETRPGAPF